MSDTWLTQALLCLTVLWPLLLLVPALHRRLRWPRHLAVLPAVLLLALATDGSLELPWLLFGTEFAIERDTRWLLAMSVVIWSAAASLAQTSRHNPSYHRATPFFLLTLAGNLGAILVTEWVGFFGFATLMGYGFYGLLVEGGDATMRRAGRLYLVFMIVADLILFEALLLAVATTTDLRYAVVRLEMSVFATEPYYLWFVLLAFALKAGIWPAHVWLIALFRSAPLKNALLLGGVPLAMGLLGMVRGLPLGGQDFYLAGRVVQLLGAAAMLYAMVNMFFRSPLALLPVWASGLFIAMLGTGLAHPILWNQYGHLAYPCIAILGLLLAALAFVMRRLPGASPQPTPALARVDALGLWAASRFVLTRRKLKSRVGGLQRHARVVWSQVIQSQQRRLSRWEKQDRWGVSITLLVLLGLAIAWLAGL